MKKVISVVISLVIAALLVREAHAVESTWEYSVQVSATVQASPPQITLTWPQDTTGVPNSYTVYRKAPGSTTWGSGVTLPGTTTSYTDTSAAAGTAYEYQVVKSSPTLTGYGYIYAGINAPLVEGRGKVVLIVDSTHAAQLAPELSRLQQDLAGDGWTVLRHDVSRTDSVVNVKNIIKADYNADPANVKSVFLFGHVPVPYSGNIVPDGHSPDHYGAWPADVYYGDMDGTWTDSSVNNSGATDARNRNVPGDGKFDQSAPPSSVELQVGRVDLANMPGRKTWGGPATFPTELQLLRQYLNKDHSFRHKLFNLPRRGVVGDYFGVRNGEAFAASGYRNFAPFFGAANITNLNVIHNDAKGVWVPHLSANSYLWAYGCGAGSYASIGGLGNSGQYNDGYTTEIVENDIKAAFTMFFGSWLGDWDSEDNIMRGVLATPSYGLSCSWSGRPHWFYHSMALGETLGHGARLTQNNNANLYRNQNNSAAGSIHVTLMGDPTLRLHPVAPPASLGGSSAAGTATLAWTPSPDSVLGYHIYRAANAAGPFTRLSSSLVAGNGFVDTSAPAGTNTYMVRAVKLETSASGTYYNASQGIFWSVGGAAVPTQDTTPPSVAVTAPLNNATISGTAVTFSATASDNVGVVGVQFKFDGNNLGSEILTAPFNLVANTTTAANGPHTLTAVARDLAGNQTTATVANLTVSNAAAATVVWVDDALPTGASGGGSAGDSWNWVSSPAPYSGTVAHQSAIAAGLHEHYFSWSSATLSVATGDTLFTYVYLDPANPPTELMLSWSADNWEHRAYWGANSITYGADGTASRRYIGALPPTGQWVRLEVPASAVALEGQTITGMSFSLFGGRATWDYTGKSAQGTTPPPPTDTTSPTVALTAPANSSTVSGSSVTVSANASDNAGVVGVQFQLDGVNLGGEDTTAPYSVTWNTTTASNGAHTLTAVARDAAGNLATATTVNVTVSNVVPDTTAPAVALTAPSGGTTVSGSSVTVSANATDNVGVAGVQFKLDGANLGGEVTSAPYSIVWNTLSAANGTHTLAAVARDAAGNQATANSVTVQVNNVVTTTNIVWVDDALPAGAGSGSSGGDSWNWVSSPTPYSGTVAHQSAIATGLHEHYFSWASATLTVATGDTLFTYVYLDPANPPSELMLSWVGDNWEHRAYWGANLIPYGTDGTASRHYAGPLPPAGQWVRLEVSASAVGLEGQTLTGMSFSLHGGRATWDYTGKGAPAAPPAPVMPTMTVAASDATATIGTSDNAVLTFTRAGDTSAALTVNYTLSGTAVKWNDYRTPAGDMPEAVTIPSGATTATMIIVGISNSTAANPETVVLTLSPDAAYTIGAANSATLTILGGAVATNPPPVYTNAPLSVSAVDYVTPALPAIGASALHVLSPNMLELHLINTKQPDPARVTAWDFVNTLGQFAAPALTEFVVTVDGVPAVVQSIGFKRRPLYAPLVQRDLRIDNCLYLQLATPVAANQTVRVLNPSGLLWPSATQFVEVANPLRYSPAIHVNQEGYVPSLPKKAMIGYYIGSLGELNVSSNAGFSLVDAISGATLYQGTLAPRADTGYTYSPTPYQKVLVADFSSFTTPGEYRLLVPGLGASLPFMIHDGVAMAFARAYALGLYHQRCGTNNALPCTRHIHDVCHNAPASVPMPASAFSFTWNTVSNYAMITSPDNPAQIAPRLTSPSAALFPFVRTGTLDASGGHHDAGDYSKYTINSASLIHFLMFAVDSLAGVAALDNLGLPESGDGISDVLQEAKWEADYLAKIQDTDGGFYFLTYPQNREYENNVLPDRGDAQVVWPKTTSATAAGVAALAQCASSPLMKQKYPAAAALYLQKAQLGWQFLTNAVALHGKNGAYQKITHYGDDFTDKDELAWAASEMFLATGDASIHQTLKSWFADPTDPATFRWGWWKMYAGFGNATRSYAFGARSGRLPASQLDAAYLAKCNATITNAGNDALIWSGQGAYGSSFPEETKHVRGAGWYFSSDQAFDITVAHQINARPEYLDAIVANMNYEGGCNPVNVSYVTGLGWKRQREIVDQYSQNDRRVLPKSGIPLGNIQQGFVYVSTYGTELSALTFPSDDAGTAPYPFYDRWGDAFNVTTEFVVLNQGRGLANLAFLASLTPLKTQAWTSATAQITGLPAQVSTNTPVTASLSVPGMNLSGARIVWEAQGQEPAYGPTFTFLPSSYGEQWVEVEAQMPDGRRVFAVTNLFASNSLPTVTVVASDTTATFGSSTDTAGFTFTRTGSTAADLTVNFQFTGTAAKWTDYRRPQGDMPESLVIPAGASSVTMTLLAVTNSAGANPSTVILTLSGNAAYNTGSPYNATVTLVATGSADNTAPAISITAPANNATVSGSTVAVSANATDNVGVAGVQFKLDGANLGAEDTSAPFSVTWNTTTAADGLHTLTAVARDAAGNQTTATAISVTVSNTVPVVPPTVTVAASDATATIGTPDNAAFTFTRTGSTTNALTVNYTLGGTAVKWNDYRTPAGDMPVSVTIPAGMASFTMSIVAVANETGANPETVVLTLSSDAAYTVGGASNATVTILTPPPVVLPTITVTATDANAARTNLDPGTFTVTRSGSTASALTVNLVFTGTATNGVDYNTVATSTTIPAGAASATITVTPKASTNLAGSQTIVLTLASNANYTVGASNTATVTLGGNSVPISSITKAGNNIRITWASVAGRAYRVAYKSNLTDTTWTNLSGFVTATGGTTTWTDTSTGASKQRYYVVYVTN
jgi:hypothetical protein